LLAASAQVYTPLAMPRLSSLLAAAVLAMAGCTGGVVTHAVPVTTPRPAMLSGDLYRPAGTGPFPAVILLHGCGGPAPNGSAWAVWLQAEGYAALTLDSFAGRHLTRLCGDASALTGGARAEDVFAAAATLAKLPFIDRERIAAMGFSHGGWTVLWASRYQSRHDDVKVRALVAFYPACGDVPSLATTAPLLMLLGGQDDWTPAEPCRLLAQDARRQGRVVVDVTYPDARHAFDASNILRRNYIAEARRGRGATIEYNSAAHADSEKQLRRFLHQYLRS
jgi:dienelactone hydrolase